MAKWLQNKAVVAGLAILAVGVVANNLAGGKSSGRGSPRRSYPLADHANAAASTPLNTAPDYAAIPQLPRPLSIRTNAFDAPALRADQPPVRDPFSLTPKPVAVAKSPGPALQPATPVAPTPFPELRLSAISLFNGTPMAVVNGTLLRAGDTIEGVTVESISSSEVSVRIGSARRTLKLVGALGTPQTLQASNPVH